MCPTGPWIQLSECVSERREVLPFLPECAVQTRDDAECSPVEDEATKTEGWKGGGGWMEGKRKGCSLAAHFKPR